MPEPTGPAQTTPIKCETCGAVSWKVFIYRSTIYLYCRCCNHEEMIEAGDLV